MLNFLAIDRTVAEIYVDLTDLPIDAMLARYMLWRFPTNISLCLRNGGRQGHNYNGRPIRTWVCSLSIAQPSNASSYAEKTSYDV